jgi:hypothetical protein
LAHLNIDKQLKERNFGNFIQIRSIQVMVEAWFMDDSDVDQRQPHKTDPPRFVSPEDLLASTGVESFKVLKIYILYICVQDLRFTFNRYQLMKHSLTLSWPKSARKEIIRTRMKSHVALKNCPITNKRYAY